MPTWLIPTLKWGGLALVIVFAITLVYVELVAPNPTPKAGASETEAPVVLYWILLVLGVIGAVTGFTMGRRQGKPTGAT